MSEFSRSPEYVSFRSSIPLRKITVDSGTEKGWKVYDSGPKSVKTPLICLPPACGTADIYFKQVLGLSAKGIRVICAEHPVYWSVNEFCSGFKKLMDALELDKVHIFGASLGGFLAQKFAEYTENCPRVASLILCNSFCDTSVFQYNDESPLFWVLPSMILKKMIMVNLPASHLDKRIIDSIDFMVEKLDSLSQQDLASRLTINCIDSHVKPEKLKHIDAVTIIDVFDECALSGPVREVLYKCYPWAKLAHLKAGGNFPYLSRSEEVNLHLQKPCKKLPPTALKQAKSSLQVQQRKQRRVEEGGRGKKTGNVKTLVVMVRGRRIRFLYAHSIPNIQYGWLADKMDIIPQTGATQVTQLFAASHRVQVLPTMDCCTIDE